MSSKSVKLSRLSYKLITFIAAVVFAITFAGYIMMLTGGGRFEQATVIESRGNGQYAVQNDSGKTYTLSDPCRRGICAAPAVGNRVTVAATSGDVQYSLWMFIALPVIFVAAGFVALTAGINGFWRAQKSKK